MKKKNYALYLLLICLLTIFSLSMFGCKKKTSQAEVVARDFLEGTFVVQDYDNSAKVEALWESDDIVIMDENDSGAIGTYSDEVNKQLEELYYGKVYNLITDNLKSKGTLIQSRTCPFAYEYQAKSDGYTTSTKSLELKETGNSTETAKTYSYTLVLEVKYDDNTVKEEKVVGSLRLVKEKDKWLVDYLEIIR